MRAEADGDVLIVTLDRADKRNALSAAFIAGITNTQPASKDRLSAFMNKTAAKVLKD